MVVDYCLWDGSFKCLILFFPFIFFPNLFVFIESVIKVRVSNPTLEVCMYNLSIEFRILKFCIGSILILTYGFLQLVWISREQPFVACPGKELFYICWFKLGPRVFSNICDSFGPPLCLVASSCALCRLFHNNSC